MVKKKSTVNAAGNYTKPTMRKNLFNQIKAGGKGGALDNGQHVKRRCLPNNIKPKVEDTKHDQVRKTYVVCSQSKKVQLQYL